MLPANDEIAAICVVPVAPKLTTQEFKLYSNRSPFLSAPFTNFLLRDAVGERLLNSFDRKAQPVTQQTK
jgi:hypothetical protein